MWHTLTNHPAHQQDANGDASNKVSTGNKQPKQDTKPDEELKKSDSASA